jgi:hypothetical protein
MAIEHHGALSGARAPAGISREEHAAQEGGRRRPATLARLAPALGLFLLAPLIAEYLLGNIAIDALGYLPVLAPMYGGGALLIREIARRTGRGWPAMIALALAFAVFEEGIVTQSLFNPGYAGANLLSATFIPALGIGLWWTLFVLTLHTVWSMSVSIAMVEALVPARSTTPWLGTIGLLVTGVPFVLGSAVNAVITAAIYQFIAPAGQLLGSLVVIAALVVVAFRLPVPLLSPVAAATPDPWLVGAVSFLIWSIFLGLTIAIGAIGAWVVVLLYLVLYAVILGLTLAWSRRSGWGGMQTLALAGGALLAYVWHAFPQWPALGTPGQIDLIGNVIFGLSAILLLIVAVARERGQRERQA